MAAFPPPSHQTHRPTHAQPWPLTLSASASASASPPPRSRVPCPPPPPTRRALTMVLEGEVVMVFGLFLASLVARCLGFSASGEFVLAPLRRVVFSPSNIPGAYVPYVARYGRAWYVWLFYLIVLIRQKPECTRLLSEMDNILLRYF